MAITTPPLRRPMEELSPAPKLVDLAGDGKRSRYRRHRNQKTKDYLLIQGNKSKPGDAEILPERTGKHSDQLHFAFVLSGMGILASFIMNFIYSLIEFKNISSIND